MEQIETWLRKQQQAGRGGGSTRPCVTLSYAQTLDGSLAARRGQPLAISGEHSLALTHRLRAAHQAVLVGIGTVLADDPRLTVRLSGEPSPQPVVLDSQLRCPPGARLLQEARSQPVIIACLPESAVPGSGGRRAALEAAGAQLLDLPAAGTDGLSLPGLLQCLEERGVHSLMVEGGAQVITSFLALGLADLLVLTLAPFFVGGLRAVERSLEAPWPRLSQPQYTNLGQDLIVWGKLALADPQQ